jgi:putative SOS response-associated peptidase YedK
MLGSTPETEDLARLLSLLKPYPTEEMETDEVSAMVNSVADDSPQCLSPAMPSIAVQPSLFD